MSADIVWCSKRGALVTGGPISLFTIAGGPVLITALYGTVTTVVGAVATTIKLTANPTTGADTDLCVAGVITAAPVGSLFAVSGVVTDALLVVLGTQGAVRAMGNGLIVQPGTIDLTVAVGGTTGACTWGCLWQPLDNNVTLLAS